MPPTRQNRTPEAEKPVVSRRLPFFCISAAAGKIQEGQETQ